MWARMLDRMDIQVSPMPGFTLLWLWRAECDDKVEMRSSQELLMDELPTEKGAPARQAQITYKELICTPQNR